MGKKTLGDANRALLSKPLMAIGCRLCFSGSKSVIFVTGLCDDNCYYCPVSRDKLGHDVFLVNEQPVSTVEELIVEVERNGSRGASITGGDPLVRIDKTIIVIKALKEHFGSDFHIHLYTSGRYATIDSLISLDQAGLDEIRFHPTDLSFLEKAKYAKLYTGMNVGVEIPVAPHLKNWVIRIVSEADKLGLDFVNLNEMEFVEPNVRSLMERGLIESKTRPFTVQGSLETAIEIVEWASWNLSIPVHFCPAPFKDKIQTRNRLLLVGKRDRRWNETISVDGTLIEFVVVRYSSETGKCLLESREVYPTLMRDMVMSITRSFC